MLTTIIFAVTHGCGPDSGSLTDAVQSQISIEAAAGRGIEIALRQGPSGQSASRPVAPVRAQDALPPFIVPGVQGKSLLRVSEHTTTEIPEGSAAVYWESGRPVIDSVEARVLNSMLDALRLCVTPEAPDRKVGSRAFKVSRVSNEDSVNPQEEAKQSIYASIQSTVAGI